MFAKNIISREKLRESDTIFADGSKFIIFGSDRRSTMWCKPNSELHPKNLRATFKPSGGNVMVWGCIPSSGTGKLVFINEILDKNKYVTILKKNLTKNEITTGIRRTFEFDQDNDPIYKIRVVQEYLLYHCSKVLHPPPQSFSFVPSEN